MAMKRCSASWTTAPTRAIESVAVQASTTGVSAGSSHETGSASSSYPIRESSGKTTTRARAAWMVSAWTWALPATFRGTQAGWTAAIRIGNLRTLT